MKTKILICGATGFIGQNLALKLSQRKDLELYGTYLKTIPNRTAKNIQFIQADLRDSTQANKIMHGMDIVIQAAATTSGSKDIMTQPYIHVTDNAVMNSLILRAAYEHRVSQLIFLSCSVMYQPSEKPVRETDFNANDEIFSSYFGVGWTKVYIEKMCEFYSRLNRTKHLVIRHSNIYGPYDKFDLEHSHVFGALITKVLTNKNGSITLWGDGSAKRDFLYIDDLVDFIEKAIDKKQKNNYEIVNVGSGSCLNIQELAQKIITCSEKKLSIQCDKVALSINTQLVLDIKKAYKSFDWKPTTTLEKGIKQTIEWYKAHYLSQHYSDLCRTI